MKLSKLTLAVALAMPLSLVARGEGEGGGGEGGAGGNGDGGNGAGGNNQSVDLNHPDIKKHIDEQVAGLKTKNNQLLQNLSKLKDTLGQYGDLTPEQVHQLKLAAQNSEEQELISQGRLEEVFNGRTERMRQAHQTALDQKDQEVSGWKTKAEKLSGKAIESALKSAAAEAGVLPSAFDDVVSRANGHFNLADDFAVVAVDGEGNLRMDSDGKTPLSPLSWVKSLKETAPHLFQAAKGGNSRGGTGQPPVGNLSGSQADVANYISSKYGLK